MGDGLAGGVHAEHAAGVTDLRRRSPCIRQYPMHRVADADPALRLSASTPEHPTRGAYVDVETLGSVPRATGMASRQAWVASASVDGEGAAGARGGRRRRCRGVGRGRRRPRARRRGRRRWSGRRRRRPATPTPRTTPAPGRARLAARPRTPHAAGDRHLGQRDREPAVGARRARRAPRARATRSRTKSCSAAAASRSAAGGVPPRRPCERGPLRTAELGLGVTEHARSRRRRAARARGGTAVSSSISPTTPTTGVGSMSRAARLVVEAHVAADDGDAERVGTRRSCRRRPRRTATSPRGARGCRS